MTDHDTAEWALKITRSLASALRDLGLETGDVFPSDNVPGGWIIEAEDCATGAWVNVEVVGGPWEDDGTA